MGWRILVDGRHIILSMMLHRDIYRRCSRIWDGWDRRSTQQFMFACQTNPPWPDRWSELTCSSVAKSKERGSSLLLACEETKESKVHTTIWRGQTKCRNLVIVLQFMRAFSLSGLNYSKVLNIEMSQERYPRLMSLIERHLRSLLS